MAHTPQSQPLSRTPSESFRFDSSPAYRSDGCLLSTAASSTDSAARRYADGVFAWAEPGRAPWSPKGCLLLHGYARQKRSLCLAGGVSALLRPPGPGTPCGITPQEDGQGPWRRIVCAARSVTRCGISTEVYHVSISSQAGRL